MTFRGTQSSRLECAWRGKLHAEGELGPKIARKAGNIFFRAPSDSSIREQEGEQGRRYLVGELHATIAGVGVGQ